MPLIQSALALLIGFLLGGVPASSTASILVEANYPGANAAIIREAVAEPIEQQVNGVEGALQAHDGSPHRSAIGRSAVGQFRRRRFRRGGARHLRPAVQRAAPGPELARGISAHLAARNNQVTPCFLSSRDAPPFWG